MNDESLDQRLNRIVRSLVLNTDRSVIDWEPLSDRSYKAVMASGAGVVIMNDDADDSYPYTLQLLNEEGDVVDAWRARRDPDLNPDTWQWEVDLRSLYVSARRQVSGANAVLTSIETDLNELDAPPF